MLNYLEKFHNLPADLQDGVSTPAVMQAIADIETEHNISLAVVVMKVMVKDVSLVDLPKLLVFEFGLDGKTARDVVEELKDKVFVNVGGYLGIAREAAINIESDIKLDDWMKQKQTETGIRSSTFFFSPEDEEEIKNLTVKLADPAIAPSDNKEIDDKIAKILPALQVNFSSVEITERLKKILFTYLRGIRNKIDTRQALMKPVDSGGMELDTFLADKIISTADKINQEAAQPPKNDDSAGKPLLAPAAEISKSKPTPAEAGELAARMKQSGVRDVDYDFGKLAEIKAGQQAPAAAPAVPASPEPEPEIKEVKKKDIVLDELHKQGVDVETPPVASPEPESETEQLPGAAAGGKPVAAAIGAAAEQAKMSPPTLNMATKRLFASKEGKAKMSDVKFVPKLVGPIDELAEMDLVNFRRLNSDPRVSAATIKEKISFLEEDNYGQRLAGIKAWRQSPLNKLYIEIGHESIMKKKGIDEIILERREAGQDYLMPEEFYAIMDLNKTLRF